MISPGADAPAPPFFDSSSLQNRLQLQQAVDSFVSPLALRLDTPASTIAAGPHAAHFSDQVASVEGFTRSLWGVIPLLSGGASTPLAALYRRALAAGVHPRSPSYWGDPGDYDQLIVESAAVAFAIAGNPRDFWEPLSTSEQSNVSNWLRAAARAKVGNNNWLLFRAMASSALAVHRQPFDEPQLVRDLDAIAAMHVADGWYADGPGGAVDLYNSFCFHFYGLLLATLPLPALERHAISARRKATSFAAQFVHWFAEDGSAIPYGRSLVYRFAQVGFWSAAAYAGLDGFDWGVVKGIVLRHLRWWLSKPIQDHPGILSVGFAYSNSSIAERYISSASPYWALKAALVLALPDTHPFWTAAERPLPDLPATSMQPAPRMLVCRHRDHVFALAAGQRALSRPRHMREKYSKFCYSNLFGFSLPLAPSGLEYSAPDNTLLLTEDDELYRGRDSPTAVRLCPRFLVSRWRPWSDVEITTWLIGVPPWHLRVHRIRTARRLKSVEGGFAAACASSREKVGIAAASALAAVRTRVDYSIIRDCEEKRNGSIVRTAPNSSILFPRTLVPVLHGGHAPGEHWICCAVAAWRATAGDAPRPAPPSFERDPRRILVVAEGHPPLFIHLQDAELEVPC